MADNPYVGLLGIMQEQGSKFNPPSICLGEVVSPDPDLKIKTEDLLLDKEDFLISDMLIGSYERNVELEGQGTLKMKFKTSLKAGDIVALMPTSNRQQYIVLCKVVKL